MSTNILLGKTLPQARKRIASFGKDNDNEVRESEVIDFDGSTHMMTIAPTGSGKGVSSVIPHLLTYKGPIIALDIKGELSAVCYKRRKQMGMKPKILDPFGITNFTSDTFNPLDISKLPNFDPDTDSYEIANAFSDGGSSRDPFWDRQASSLLAAMIHLAWLFDDKEKQTLATIRNKIGDDLAYKLAVILDTKKNLPMSIRSAFQNYLVAPEKETRPSIDATLASYFASLYSDKIDEFMASTSFNLMDIVNGENTDIFIVIPPEKLESHGKIIRMIFTSIFKAILARKVRPKQNTLILMDECYSLGKFSLLLNMVSLSRGYGVTISTYWQDISQIKSTYKDAYSMLINNTGVLQLFGTEKYESSVELSKITGVPPKDFINLEEDEQYLQVKKKIYMPAKKLNYLRDIEFENLFEPNPFFPTERERKYTYKKSSGK